MANTFEIRRSKDASREYVRVDEHGCETAIWCDTPAALFEVSETDEALNIEAHRNGTDFILYVGDAAGAVRILITDDGKGKPTFQHRGVREAEVPDGPDHWKLRRGWKCVPDKTARMLWALAMDHYAAEWAPAGWERS